MTEPEIREWLGIPPDYPRRLRPEVVEGMAKVPRPPDGPTDDHTKVFAALLGCLPDGPGRRWRRLFVAEAIPGE